MYIPSPTAVIDEELISKILERSGLGLTGIKFRYLHGETEENWEKYYLI
jgi:hypothetical protein